MDLGINGRVAMVAAASKGIGFAVARALAGEGCRVTICSRDPAALEKARERILTEVPDAAIRVFPCDVTNGEELAAWHRATAGDLGPVDILVTNTGGPPAATFLDLSEEEWRRGIDLTAKQPIALLTLSSTLRAGLSALTKTMSNEFSREGVLVNAVVPGHILTARQDELNEIRSKREGVSIEEYAARTQTTIPIGRYGQPREIGEVVAFLASERASYVTGATIQVDGGLIQSTF